MKGPFCSSSYILNNICFKGRKNMGALDPLNFFLIYSEDLKKKFFFNVYLFLGQRETVHERGRGRERGRHRIRNRLQALSHQPTFCNVNVNVTILDVLPEIL